MVYGYKVRSENDVYIDIVIMSEDLVDFWYVLMVFDCVGCEIFIVFGIVKGWFGIFIIV